MLRQGQDDRFRDDIHTFEHVTSVWKGIDPDMQTILSTEIPISDVLPLIRYDVLRNNQGENQGENRENQRKSYVESIRSIVGQMKKFRKKYAHRGLTLTWGFPNSQDSDTFMRVTFETFPEFLERWGAARLKNLGRSTRNRLTVTVAGEIPKFDERVPLPILLEIFPYHRALRLVLDQNLDRHSQIHPGLEDAFEFIQPNVLEVKVSSESDEMIDLDLCTLFDLSNTKRTRALEIISRGAMVELYDSKEQCGLRRKSVGDDQAGHLVFDGTYFGISGVLVPPPREIPNPSMVYEECATLNDPFLAPNLEVLRCRGAWISSLTLSIILQSAQRSLVVVSLAHSLFAYSETSTGRNQLRDILSQAPRLKSIEIGTARNVENIVDYQKCLADILEDKLTGRGFHSLEHVLFVLPPSFFVNYPMFRNKLAALESDIERIVQNAQNVSNFIVTIAGFKPPEWFVGYSDRQNILNIQQMLSSKGVAVSLVGGVLEDDVHFDKAAGLNLVDHPYSPLDIPGLDKICVGQLEANIVV